MPVSRLVRRSPAADVAACIAGCLAQGRRDHAVRHFIQLADDLAAAHGEAHAVIGAARPEATGERCWDAAIAALVEHRLLEEGLRVPAWVAAEGFRVEPPWMFRSGLYDIPAEPGRGRPPCDEQLRGVVEVPDRTSPAMREGLSRSEGRVIAEPCSESTSATRRSRGLADVDDGAARHPFGLEPLGRIRRITAREPSGRAHGEEGGRSQGRPRDHVDAARLRCVFHSAVERHEALKARSAQPGDAPVHGRRPGRRAAVDRIIRCPG